MEWWIVFFLTGVFSSLLWPELPPVYCLISILIGACILWLLSYKNITALLLGTLWVGSVGQWVSLWQLPIEQISKKSTIKGTVSSLVVAKKGHPLRFNVRLTHFNGNKLTWRNPNIRLSWRVPSVNLNQGDQVMLTVKLKPAHGLSNQGGFDYLRWLLTKDVLVTGYVVKSNSNKLIKSNNHYRQSAVAYLQTITDEQKYGRLFQALLLGNRGSLTNSDWQLFQLTGTSHLVAISGLHLALLGALFLVIVRLTIGAICYLINAHHFPRFWLEVVLTLCLLVCYAWLAGFSIPTIRALIIVVLVAVSLALGIKLNRLAGLLLCLLVTTLFYPLAIYSTSFWLSFSAVTLIGFLVWRFSYLFYLPVQNGLFARGLNISINFLHFQLFLSLLMLPVTAIFFDQISLIVPLANLLAVPLIAFIILPLSLFGFALSLISEVVSQFVFSVADSFAELFYYWLEFVMKLSPEPFELARVSMYSWLIFLLAIVILAMPIRLLYKMLVILLFCPVFSYFIPVKTNGWRIDVLDVGQGLAVLISRNQRAILYDLGASYPSGFNMVDAVIKPQMSFLGIQEVDHIIVSHGDNDHAGGLKYLTADISKIYFSMPEYRQCNAMTKNIDWQDLTIEFLSPDIDTLGSRNNRSCVVAISSQKHRLLLPGDIEQLTELKLLKQKKNLAADILIAPHHGSNTSSSARFIKAVSPEHVVFSTGFYNRWKFPADQVVESYQELGTRTYNTAVSGQISFLIDKQIDVRTYHQHWHRRWYRNFSSKAKEL